jgi:integrase
VSIRTLQPPTECESELIARGRAAFAPKFPGQGYDGDSWNIQHLKCAGAGSGNVNLHFCRLSLDARVPLHKRYSEVIKANLATSALKPGSMVNRLESARWLWEAIIERMGSGEAFTWQALRKVDAERAEEMMISRGLKPSSVYRRCVNIATLLDELSLDGIIGPMVPAFATPRIEDSSRHTIAGREERSQILLTQRAIDALAQIHRGEFTLSPTEQLISCVATLLFASGLRIQEILQIPVDALREEGGKHFLYYFKAKSQKVFEEKIALTKLQAELAREAIERAMRLTADARVQATALTRSPDLVPLPAWARGKSLFSKEEVARLIGVKPLFSHIPGSVTRVRDCGSEVLLDGRALQEYVQSFRQRTYPESIRGVTQTEGGGWMPLDRALFLVFHNQGHSVKATNPLLVGLLGQGQVGDFLGGREGLVESIFQRLGLLEKSGKPISINSHQLRHYVTTKASGSGIPDVYIMRWQRREHAGDIESYKHLTAEERIKQLHAAIKEGRLAGEIATMYFRIAEDERDIFLEGVVQAMHLTHFGFCIHDFNTAPCPKAMNCIKGCGSFLFDPNDATQIDNVKRARHLNVVSLQEMKKAVSSGGAAYSGAWIRDAEETIAGADKLLAVTAPAGEVVRPFSGQPSKFQEL